jgi:hypothetical protein
VWLAAFRSHSGKPPPLRRGRFPSFPKEEFMKQLSLLFVLLACASRVAGCDLCGCYTPQLQTLPPSKGVGAGSSWVDGFYGAVAEQFTHFGTLQVDGHEVANPTDEHLDSSITQLVGGYNFSGRLLCR